MHTKHELISSKISSNPNDHDHQDKGNKAILSLLLTICCPIINEVVAMTCSEK